MSNLIVAKFGGTSLADATQFQKVMRIIQDDPNRRYIVVSAPGKRSLSDQKITDLLLVWHQRYADGDDCSEIEERIYDRFTSITDDLGLRFGSDMRAIFDTMRRSLQKDAPPDYLASRGEFLSAQILSAATGYPFVDASQLIAFDEDGKYSDVLTSDCIKTRLKNVPCAIIPGFYGRSWHDGAIRTFSRGGSDITGAVIAKHTHAALYENWTDVSGICSADPRVVSDARILSHITYHELRELTYAGAGILHEEAVRPVRTAGIPIRICNTNDPEDAGTRVVLERLDVDRTHHLITGIAAREGFVSVTVEKDGMNDQVGSVLQLLEIMKQQKISLEHMPSGIDNVSLIIHESELPDVGLLASSIESTFEPCIVKVQRDIALIVVVGNKMRDRPGISGRIFDALGKDGINVLIIDQGASQLSITVGVKNEDCERAIRAIHQAFDL